MTNVKYQCDPCNHSAHAPPNTEPACRDNKGDACEMVQVEHFPALPPEPEKTSSTSTKKAADAGSSS